MPADQHPLWAASGDLRLEAVLQLPSLSRPAALLVICHPHPQYGGSMDNNVVAALGDAALQEGMAALRFNFRGVGASDGVYSGGAGETDDVLAVLQAAREQPGGHAISLAGYSFGAAMAAAACNRPGVLPRSLVLVSPPLRSGARQPFLAGPPARLLITGDRDPICPSSELEALAGECGASVTSAIVDGADHSWLGHEAELRDTVGGFLRWHAAQP